MKSKRFLSIVLLALSTSLAFAQVEVDYTRPRKYIVGDVSVEGNTYFSSNQIVSQTGLLKGREVTIPGDDISDAIKKLTSKGFFEDVGIYIDHFSPARDSVWLTIKIMERPRVSKFSFTGVKSSEKKDLEERLNLRRGRDFSDYVKNSSVGIIKRYYAEKGYLLCEVDVQTRKDSMVRHAIQVNFAVDKGPKVRIKDINFIGNEHLSDYKLAKSMKKTKSNKFYNFFNSKKFNEKEYPEDKKSLISAFNEAGYRDARIVRDSVYMVDVVGKNGKVKKRICIDIEVDEGKKYYFRDVKWTGNSVYSAEALNEVLKIQKGDVYDKVTLQKRLYGGGRQTRTSPSSIATTVTSSSDSSLSKPTFRTTPWMSKSASQRVSRQQSTTL